MSERNRTWLEALAILALALFARATIFHYPIDEGDELIYKALVEQLALGHGYTLHGHPLLANNWVAQAQYDSPVFYHPPVAIYFFYGVVRAVGFRLYGLQLAQVLSFIIFYLCGWRLTEAYAPGLSRPSRALALSLLAFLPIYAHANMKVWIDNPRVAFFSLHWLLLTEAFRRPRSFWLYGAAALSSFLPVLCKIDGLMAYPFAYALAFTLAKREKGKAYFLGALLAVNLGAAGLWLWFSEALKYGSGKPSAELLALNPFIRLVTIELSSWQFLLDYFKEEATILPCLLLCFFAQTWKRTKLWVSEGILAAWILGHAAIYAILGLFGFSKVLRYIVMATPAEALLFAVALLETERIFHERKSMSRERRWLLYTLGGFVILAWGMEIYQGACAIWLHARTPWLRPLY